MMMRVYDNVKCTKEVKYYAKELGFGCAKVVKNKINNLMKK